MLDSLGDKIKSRRLEINMSVEELGELIGKDKTTILRYERGVIKDIHLSVFINLCKALNVDYSYFLLEKDASENIGDRIKRIRKDRELSQLELAKFTNLSRSFMSKIENNKRNISDELIEKIAKALNTNFDYIKYEKGDINDTKN